MLVLFVSAFAAAAISGSAGFGGALLLLPLLVGTVGVTHAVPLLTMAQLIGNLKGRVRFHANPMEAGRVVSARGCSVQYFRCCFIYPATEGVGHTDDRSGYPDIRRPEVFRRFESQGRSRVLGRGRRSGWVSFGVGRQRRPAGGRHLPFARVAPGSLHRQRDDDRAGDAWREDRGLSALHHPG